MNDIVGCEYTYFYLGKESFKVEREAFSDLTCLLVYYTLCSECQTVEY